MNEFKLQDIAKITDRIEIHISLLPEGIKIGYVFTSKLDGYKYGSYLIDTTPEHLEDTLKWIRPLSVQAELLIERLSKGGEQEKEK